MRRLRCRPRVSPRARLRITARDARRFIGGYNRLQCCTNACTQMILRERILQGLLCCMHEERGMLLHFDSAGGAHASAMTFLLHRKRRAAHVAAACCGRPLRRPGARANGIRYPLSLPRDMASRGRVQSKETSMKSRYRLMRLSIVSAAVLAAASVETTQTAAAQAGKDFKVAYLPCGRVNDQSWSQAGYEGVVAAKKELGVETAYSESVPPADIEAAARDYATRGYNVVLLHCATFTDAGLKVAKDFPKTWFTVTSAFAVPANVVSINLQQQQGTFVAGVLAGMVTKSSRLGAILSYNTLGFNRQSEGFRLGARFVNPKSELAVTYLNNAEDAAKAKEAALAQYDTGADVILAATDQAANGVFRAGTERGRYVIAEYADQNARAPNAILGSVVFEQAHIISSIIKSVVNGTAKGEVIEPGVKERVGILAQNTALLAKVPADARECLQLILQSFDEGKMRIPDDRIIAKQNAAKIIDTASVVEGGKHPCLNKRS
jgi:basic membrane protein A